MLHPPKFRGRRSRLRALLVAGVPLPVAQAAASNPTVLKSVAGQAFAQTQPSTPQAPQPPQAMTVRLAGGGDAVKWDPTRQQHVQMPEATDK